MDATRTDVELLRRAITLAARARENGNHPFGALVVTAAGRVVEGLNTVVTERDPTGHAETNAVRRAAAELTPDELRASTLYTSTEPCAMCSGAIYWAVIPRVVYALGSDELDRIVHENDGEQELALPSREVFSRGGRATLVVGPVPLPGAAEVHAEFWDRRSS